MYFLGDNNCIVESAMAEVHGKVLGLRDSFDALHARIQLPSVMDPPDSDLSAAHQCNSSSAASWYPFISVNIFSLLFPFFFQIEKDILSLHHFSPKLESVAPDCGCKLKGQIN